MGRGNNRGRERSKRSSKGNKDSNSDSDFSSSFGGNQRFGGSGGGFRSSSPDRFGGGGGGGFKSGPKPFNSGPRELHKATCSECGTACEVPFKPTEGKPVYCRNCFAKRKPQRF